MATISHEPVRLAQRPSWAGARNLWVSLTIMVIWLAVLFVGVFGPAIRSVSAGGDSSTVPTVLPVAAIAFLATWVVAKYGLTKENDD